MAKVFIPYGTTEGQTAKIAEYIAVALGEGATWRVLATRPGRAGDTPFGEPGEEVPASDIQRLLDAAGLDVTVRDLAWSSGVRLQHRLAGSFRRGVCSSLATPPTRTRQRRRRA